MGAGPGGLTEGQESAVTTAAERLPRRRVGAGLLSGGAPALQRGLSVLSILAAWLLLSSQLGESVLPGPVATVGELWREYRDGDLLFHVWKTVQRTLAAFALAVAGGAAAGVGMGASPAVDRVAEAWLLTGLAVPRLLPIVCAYLVIGLSDAAAIAAIALTAAPVIAVQVREGTRVVDRRLVQMARAFRRSSAAILRRVVVPQIVPFVVGAARAGMSQTWKMVVFAELMGRTNGVGYQIAFYFQTWHMRGILAYGLAMVVLLAAFDVAVFGTLQRLAFRWRGPVRTGVLE